MTTPFRYAYLHGFGSSRESRKGLHLATHFGTLGIHIERPELNVPSFAKLTLTGALSAIDRMDSPGPPWRFVGSSMGGYLAARWTELHPDRVDRLILLCPGFDMAQRWREILGPDLLSSWEKEGALSFADGTGHPTEVHWGLMEDGRNHPAYPEVPCPTVIIHGTKDDRVPISSSQDYAYGHAERRLMEVDDDHGLMDSLPLIRDTVASFFEFDLVRTEE